MRLGGQADSLGGPLSVSVCQELPVPDPLQAEGSACRWHLRSCKPSRVSVYRQCIFQSAKQGGVEALAESPTHPDSGGLGGRRAERESRGRYCRLRSIQPSRVVCKHSSIDTTFPLFPAATHKSSLPSFLPSGQETYRGSVVQVGRRLTKPSCRSSWSLTFLDK